MGEEHDSRFGLWLRGEALELNLGVEDEFRPARRALPAFRVREFDALAAALQASEIPLAWDEAMPGRRRFFCADSVGNRLEFVEAS